ncbi:g4487 [Coccomyxa elongata]
MRWDVKSAPTLWGPEIGVSIDFMEPGNKPATAKKHCPKRLRISKQPFAIGGMRLAYYAVTNAGHRYVVKRLLREAIQPENNVAAFLEDTNAHREAAGLAVAFGDRCKLHKIGARMEYGPLYIVQIPCMDEVSSSGQMTVLLLEQYLEGKFTKWNTNTGNAYSHFTYCKTHKAADGPKLVVDIQGVKDAEKTLYHLTDPAVHFAGGGCCGFGDTNCGTRGIKSFFDSHQCNSVCRSLGLRGKPSS